MSEAEKCAAKVWHRRGVGGEFYSCQKRAVAGGLCSVHRPETVAAREARTDAAYAKKRRESLRRFLAYDIGRAVLDDLEEGGQMQAKDYGKIGARWALKRWARGKA